MEDWISDALTTTTTTNIYGVILLWLALDKHWFRYMQELMNSFPDCCGLCEKHWRLNASLESIIENLERCERQGHRFCLTPEDIRFIGLNSDAHMRFDADDTQQTTASGSVSLMTAAGSESLPVNENLESCERQGHRVCLTPEDIRFVGCNSDAHMTFDADDTQQTTASGSVSLPTAAGDQSARSSEACKRPAWADITDAAESPEEKKQRKVGFVEGSPDSSSSEAPEDAYDVLVLQCDLRNKVLLRHGTQRVTAREDSTCLLWANSKRQKFRLQEEDDISALVNGMEFLLLNNEDLQSEMNRLDMTISESNLYPTPCQKEASALHRLQFYLFLHMWSVLKRDYSFFVSSKLLRLATLPLQAEFNYDAWTIISRYCYLLWLHRTDGPDVWSQSMMTLLLPDSEEWDMWWKREQLSAQEISQIAFNSEEYGIMIEDPLNDSDGKKIKEELVVLSRCIKLADLPLGPELPREHSWYQHDVYVGADESLPTPRAVPVFRCSAGVAEDVAWGNKDGKPQEMKRENVIHETHCFLEVDVPVPARMTLRDVVGTRDWEQSFRDVSMPLPYWSFSAQNACGSSARANEDLPPSTSLATQIHLQALGAEIMATLRPDNVMHPHLRCHVEFILGMFAAAHLERRDDDEVFLHEFLAGCGIRVKEVALTDDPGWIDEAYKQRHNDEGSVVRPMCHTIWGEKTRPLGYRVGDDPEDVWYYLVHDCCPFHECTNHKTMLGFGTLCNYWHGFNKKHGKICTLAANRTLQYAQIGNKGRTTRGARGVDQYFKTFLERIGMIAPPGTNTEGTDERVCLVGLPRWLPQFYGQDHGPPGQDLVPFHARSQQRHFVQEDREECLTLVTHATNLFDEMIKLL